MPAPIKLLLVEDDQVDAKAVTAMLAASTAARYEVSCADSFSAAAAALGASRFDAVLLDLGLPDSFELETLAKIVPLAAGVPIVVLSGLEDGEFAAKAKRQGASDYLFKGEIGPRVLDQALGRALAGRPAGDGTP